MEQKIEKDLQWEHSQHTSDDWRNLENKCSECYKIYQNKKYGHSRNTDEVNENALGRLDYSFKNPLE